MQIILPNHVKKCISTLQNAGYEAFCVGGAVRDLISKIKQPHDFDVAVNCPPEKVISLFERTIPTGIKHGTVTVLIDGIPIEVTTYRVDGDYTDARHPDSVRFVGSIKEDLSRRDFTVNAIAYNEQQGIFDPFDGCGDIENKILRTVGDADLRFKEDALRIIRLFRFASVLGFKIEENTAQSAHNNAYLLPAVSVERITAELQKMLTGNFLCLAAPFFEQGHLAPFGIEKCDISPLCAIECDLAARFSLLCHINGQDAAALCERLKTDNRLKNVAKAVCEMLLLGFPSSRAEIKRYLSRYGNEAFEAFIKTAPAFGIDGEILKSELSDILQSGEPYSVSQLAVGGDDLKALGFCGKEIGTALERLKETVIDNPTLNRKEKLLQILTK